MDTKPQTNAGPPKEEGWATLTFVSLLLSAVLMGLLIYQMLKCEAYQEAAWSLGGAHARKELLTAPEDCFRDEGQREAFTDWINRKYRSHEEAAKAAADKSPTPDVKK